MRFLNPAKCLNWRFIIKHKHLEYGTINHACSAILVISIQNKKVKKKTLMDQLQAFYRVNHEHLISFNFHAWTVTAASPSISNDILKFLMKMYDNKINIFHSSRLRQQMTLVDGSGW